MQSRYAKVTVVLELASHVEASPLGPSCLYGIATAKYLGLLLSMFLSEGYRMRAKVLGTVKTFSSGTTNASQVQCQETSRDDSP